MTPNTDLSFPPSDTQVSTCISVCLRGMQRWMDNHHLKLNPGKMVLIFIPALTSPFSYFFISLGDSKMTSPRSARNLGLVTDNRLSLSENITTMTWTCRFLLYNIQRIRLFLSLLYSVPFPSNGPVLPRLLHLSAGWPPSICRQTPTILCLPRHFHIMPGTPAVSPSLHMTSWSRLQSVLAPQWWNDVLVDIRTAESLTTFKFRLKTHLFSLHLSLAISPS